MHTLPPTDNATQPRRRAPSSNGDNGARAPSTNGYNGRDAAGRFTKGNPGGPGNPFARRLAALRRALCEAVTEDDVRAVVRRLLEQARQGDVAAVKLLFAYAIGRPADAVDPDTLDLREWQMYRDSAARQDDLTALLAGVPPDIACALARAVLPYLGDAFARHFVEQVRAEAEEDRQDEADEGP